jgi:NADPH-dependent curcumin reductase CurA
MPGATVSQVVRSRSRDFAEGDIVLGYDGWQTYGISAGRNLRKLNPDEAPIVYALGVLGMPGLTAYVGLLDIGKPRPHQTVVVSSAAGAVGSVVGQIAKIKDCRAVGIAGSDEKCQYLKTIGYDAAINYKTQDLPAALREACPAGIDVYTDMVGGATLEAVLPLVNLHARIPLIGLMSQYTSDAPPPGPNLGAVLARRVLIQGMIVSDHSRRQNAFLRDMTAWLKQGRIKYKIDLVGDLRRAPEAFLGLFAGRNIGKLVVQVSRDPTQDVRAQRGNEFAFFPEATGAPEPAPEAPSPAETPSPSAWQTP